MLCLGAQLFPSLCGLRLGAWGTPLTRAPSGRWHGDREPQSAQAPRVGTADDPSPVASGTRLELGPPAPGEVEAAPSGTN